MQRKVERPARAALADQQQTGAQSVGEPLAMELQRSMGNRTVSQLFAPKPAVERRGPSAREGTHSGRGGELLQRNEIAYDDPGETIYNQTSTQDSQGGNNAGVARGTAGAKAYGGGTVATGSGIRYEMKRSDTQVDVTVRIRFVDQTRVTPANLPDGSGWKTTRSC